MSEKVIIGDATLYCGDCLEILPTLGNVDAVITDPPYGTGWVRGGGSVGEFNAKHEKPDWDVWSTEWLKVCLTSQFSVFCPIKRVEELANELPDRAVGYYRKTNVRPGGIAREGIVYSPAPAAPLDFECYNGDCSLHPCQKPLPLMLWLVAKFAGSVLDPFMGSASTGEASVLLGRRFIGIERDPAHFATACERIDNAYRQARMFA